MKIVRLQITLKNFWISESRIAAIRIFDISQTPRQIPFRSCSHRFLWNCWIVDFWNQFYHPNCHSSKDRNCMLPGPFWSSLPRLTGTNGCPSNRPDSLSGWQPHSKAMSKLREILNLWSWGYNSSFGRTVVQVWKEILRTFSYANTWLQLLQLLPVLCQKSWPMRSQRELVASNMYFDSL